MENSSSKTVGILIVLIIIIAGLWLMTRKPATDMDTAPTDNSYSSETSGTQPAGESSTAITSGNSDADLEQDSVSIEAELGAFAAENSSASETVQ